MAKKFADLRAKMTPEIQSRSAARAEAMLVEMLVELSTFVPKGVYRYKTHQEANEHEQRCIGEGLMNMAASGFGQDGHCSRVKIEGPPKEDDLVELVAVSPAGRPVGAVGVVVHVYPNAEAFEVEFNTEAGYSVETILSNMCQTVMVVNAMLKRWVSQLSQRAGRSDNAILEDGLLASDFPSNGVRILFEDGSDLRFKNAFYLGDVANRIAEKTICRVAVFSEHVGHHEFWIGPEDQIDVVALACAGTRLENKLEDFSPDRHGGEIPQASVSHEAATIQEFKDNPQEASTYLKSALADGNHEEIMQALRRINASCDSRARTDITRDYRKTVAVRVEKEPAFAVALLDEARALFLNGEPAVAKQVLSVLI